jgi:hypothetical protein
MFSFLLLLITCLLLTCPSPLLSCPLCRRHRLPDPCDLRLTHTNHLSGQLVCSHAVDAGARRKCVCTGEWHCGGSKAGWLFMARMDCSRIQYALAQTMQPSCNHARTLFLLPLPCISTTPHTYPLTLPQEFFNRMEHEARTMLSSRFIPHLQFTGVNHEVALLRMRVHKSAAGIAEVGLCVCVCVCVCVRERVRGR